ncbi:arylesterase [Marinobacterium nitratireducens]|uniref:Arylesterase n=1 Tax=Marinobacterium nitratireducens TaxID=518897 RepID=A0A917ZN08_9GAMM|nr:GDSL-type esterase/lipase family protein [Marinobacterium nitratireducens]GGO86860.1 arylesterase [Marinobacterium nitratireducens]
MRLLKQAFLVLAACLALAGCGRDPQLDYLPPGSKVLAFGDSLTFGTGAGSDQSYPARLAQATGWELVNAGVPGELAEDGVPRLRELLEREAPALVLLCHGGNNLLRGQPEERVRGQLVQMIELARDHRAQLVLLGVPRPSLLVSTADVYQELAEQYDLVYLPDAIADTLSDPSLKSDQVHPNAAGYARIADELLDLLRSAGAV